ncbi:FAD-dependent monooxygenase [Ktedonobacter sp. SOSP1-85]|uniref:FAD-dependent monooxygenase n=2 Tax=Ktedonobacter sp. SOSP1-85 TaxID=2778367 RepID=UPI001915C297|nr:FAD-dependent monooxygenase [Ktedonobacter sp. SOSP1-85]
MKSVRGSTLQEVTTERKQKLVGLFPNEMPIIHQMINATQEMFPDFPTYIIKQKPRWHTSKVSLIGDAAHAVSSSSGQGASMAMEDALIMAKCLRDIPQTEEAFSTFERLRAKRVEKILDLGLKGDSGKFSKGDFQVWMRDAMTSFFLTFFANEKGMRWVYDYPLEWGTPIETAK